MKINVHCARMNVWVSVSLYVDWKMHKLFRKLMVLCWWRRKMCVRVRNAYSCKCIAFTFSLVKFNIHFLLFTETRVAWSSHSNISSFYLSSFSDSQRKSVTVQECERWMATLYYLAKVNIGFSNSHEKWNETSQKGWVVWTTWLLLIIVPVHFCTYTHSHFAKMMSIM